MRGAPRGEVPQIHRGSIQEAGGRPIRPPEATWDLTEALTAVAQ